MPKVESIKRPKRPRARSQKSKAKEKGSWLQRALKANKQIGTAFPSPLRLDLYADHLLLYALLRITGCISVNSEYVHEEATHRGYTTWLDSWEVCSVC